MSNLSTRVIYSIAWAHKEVVQFIGLRQRNTPLGILAGLHLGSTNHIEGHWSLVLVVNSIVFNVRGAKSPSAVGGSYSQAGLC